MFNLIKGKVVTCNVIEEMLVRAVEHVRLYLIHEAATLLVVFFVVILVLLLEEVVDVHALVHVEKKGNGLRFIKFG